MKALWLRELQALLSRDDVSEWWRFMASAEEMRNNIRGRHEELLAQVKLMEFRSELTQKNAIDALYQAGEYEDLAVQLEADASEIENKSYEAVGNFETQRIAVSEFFSHMGALEHFFLNIQAEVKSLQTSIEGAKDSEQREELNRLLKKKEAELSKAERELRESNAVYERENNRKVKLWEEVEQMWTRSLDIHLGVAERRMKSKRARMEAERLFKESEQHKKRVDALRQETEESSRKQEELIHAVEEHRALARRLFQCLVGEDFLYWPQRENDNKVYCVPISTHQSGFNIELQARTIYQINRQRGVEFIEPIPPEGITNQDNDDRIDGFFLAPLKVPPVEPPKS
jgi:hypothetical protein